MDKQDQLLMLTADIARAHFSNNTVPVGDVGIVISNIYGALAAAGTPVEVVPEYTPAVDPKKSVKPDAITSLIDGKPYKMLKRHLTTHGLTPDEYRQRYGLRPDYPMVAANYAAVRAKLAKEIGLGRKPGQRRGRARAH